MLIRHTSRDFDELAGMARGWRIELCKLDAQPFLGEMFQWITPGFILSRGCFSSRVKQAGAPPPGLRTFAVPGTPNLQMLWRGRQVGGNDLMGFPAGGELDAISCPGFEVITVSVPEQAITETGEALGLQGLAERCQTLEVLRCDPRQMLGLRNLLQQMISRAGGSNADPLDARSRFIETLVRLAGVEGSPATRRFSSTRRRGLIRDAGRLILSHPLDPPKVQDLWLALGVSKRTLEYSFREHVGLSPKAYISALRLNQVRKILKAARPGETHVADAANAWGYWHMGQLAADYRKLFGELPSETLKGSG